MRPRGKPRIRKWQGAHYLFYWDHNEAKAVRKSCLSLGVTTAEGRKELVKRYRAKTAEEELEVIKHKGVRTAYDTNLLHSLKRYLKNVDERVEAKKLNPESDGLSPASAVEVKRTLKWFMEWLENSGHAKLTTGELSAAILKKFLLQLSTGKSNHGKRIIQRSGATLNKHGRNLSSALNWIKGLRPKQFPDFEDLRTALKPKRVDPPEPVAFSPEQLGRFYRALWEREQPGFMREVSDGRRKAWKQPAQATCETPQSRLFLLLALTGMRLEEAKTLKWEKIDLERGRIRIDRRKTARRWLPLTGAIEGEVSPGLLGVLKDWKEEAGKREFVLPHATSHKRKGYIRDKQEEPDELGDPEPFFDRDTWVRIGKELGLRQLMPQTLRQNFVSYCASIGVPPAVAALWTGHGTDVAEKFYRAQVLVRNRGESIEEAMGLLATDVPQEENSDLDQAPARVILRPRDSRDSRWEGMRAASAAVFEDLIADAVHDIHFKDNPNPPPRRHEVTITLDQHVVYRGEVYGPFTHQPLNMLREARYSRYVVPLKGDWGLLRDRMPFLDTPRMLRGAKSAENRRLRKELGASRDQIVLIVGSGLQVRDLADLYK